MSRVYEGLYLSTPDKFKTKADFVKLWRNECHRVFADRLINDTDAAIVLEDLVPNLVKLHFRDCEQEVLVNELFFGDFGLSDPDEDSEDPRLYENLSLLKVKEKFELFLSEYNENGARSMNLVLFTDALEHLTRIHRVIRFPKGSALLVGFGGSGKQSLTKLASYMAGCEIFRLSLTRTYSLEDFKEDLKKLYSQVLKQPTTFMFTDSDVVEEGFLELINNILTIGMVPSLFPEEEKEALMSPLDAEISRKKLPQTKDFRWGYFVTRARENIHIACCMSPAGENLRIRCRSFPGLVSNTSIDWFFPWPAEALQDVATNFINNSEIQLEGDLKAKIIEHIVMIHISVQRYSQDFETIYKRKNYSTPKNYLDFIRNYIKFIGSKRKNIDSSVTRLEGGLATLAKAAEDTAVLQEELAVQDADIAEKKAVVEEMILKINEKTLIANKQEAEAEEKKAYLEVQNKEITVKKAQADEELERARPIVEEAQAALLNVQNKDLAEMKSSANPNKNAVLVCLIAYHLFVPLKIQNESARNDDWVNIKTHVLGDMRLLENLKNFPIDKVKSEMSKKAKGVIAKLKKEMGGVEGKELEAMIKSKTSTACLGLYKWAASTDKYYDIFCDVEPLKKQAEKM